MNKIAANAAQLAKYILLHAYSRTVQLLFPAARAQIKTSYSLWSWHNNIFGYTVYL